MKFTSKWSKAIYIVRPSLRGIDQMGIVTIRPGLRAIFDADTHMFDSRIAQDANGWSDDERKAVEAFLLKHKDYGNGMILMPGQDIPDEMKAVARVDREQVASKCQHVDFIEGEIKQCENESLPGGTKCEVHKEKKAKIIQGMLTT